MENPKEYFSNEKCSVVLNKDKTFSGTDRTDYANGTRFYTRNIRSWKKGLAILVEKFTENTTMYQAMNMLSEVGLNPRSYCSVD
jgi:hypothetical protein